MAKRLTSFRHGGENYNKVNHFIYTQVVDNNGFALTAAPFVSEYYEKLRDFIGETHTQTIVDRDIYDKVKIHRLIPDGGCFFKVVHPEIIKNDFKNMEQGRIKDANYMFYKSLSGAIASTEEYHKGIVWFMGGYRMFETLAPFLNRIYLLRLNIDFTTMPDIVLKDEQGNETKRIPITDLLDTTGMYDPHNFQRYGIKLINTIESDQSKKWVDIMNKPKENVSEILDNGMIMTTESKEAREEQKLIPSFYDYKFEEYAFTTKYKGGN